MMSEDEPQRSDDGAYNGTNDETVLMVEPSSTNPTTTPTNQDSFINGCSMNDGAYILFATDEWFASADHLLLDTPPTFDPAAYCSQGKVMDGWETQRKRQLGHDFCLIQLSQRLVNISAIEIDTAYFTGNQTPYVSIWACDLSQPAEEIEFLQNIPHITPRLVVQMKRQQQLRRRRRHENDDEILPVDEYRGTYATPESILTVHALTACHDNNNNNNNKWYELLPVSPLRPGYESTRYHHFAIPGHAVATHIRFNYYPDGGVARLRIYGTSDARMTTTTTSLPQALVRPVTTTCTVVPYTNENEDADVMDANHHDHNINPNTINSSNDIIVEVSGIHQGGRGIYASNQHYGTPHQLLSPHSGRDMSDGWETARQPTRPQILQPLATTAVSNQPHGDMTTTNDQNNANDSNVNVPPPLVDFGILMEYCILKLGYPISNIHSIIIDTKHFKGNYPESVELAGCCIAPTDDDADLDCWAHDDDMTTIHWYPILHRSRLSPHAQHVYAAHQLRTADTRISHVRVRIFPDGGLSRVRIYTTTTPRPDEHGDPPTTLSVGL